MQNVQDSIWVPIAEVEDVAVVLHTAMLAGGWSPGPSNPTQRLLTGNLQTQIIEENFTWNYKFDLILRWAPQQRNEFTHTLLPSESNPRPALTTDDQLENFAPESNGHTIFMQISEKSENRSGEVLQQRLEAFKETLVHESLISLAIGPPKANPKIYPSASFSTIDQVRSKGYLDPYDDERRFIVSKIDDQFLSIPPRQSNRHVLVSGPTGTGKSKSIFAPNIIERSNISMIVTEATAGDETPHLYTSTAGWRAYKGHRIFYFNPEDLTSDQLNPLDMIRTDRDARMVCELIMKTTTQKSHRGDQFWDTSERMLLTALLLHVCGFRREGSAHLRHVVELVNRSEDELRRVAKHTPVQQAYDRFEAFFSRGTENTRNIVLSCLGQRLDLWNDERTHSLTYRTSIDAQLLKDELFTFYLVLSAEKDQVKPLAILVWHYILHLVTNNKFQFPLALILDEFANLGYVRGMKEKLSLFRHLDICVAFGLQDNDQLEIIYEKESSIFFSQPATKLFLTPNDLPKAKPISDMLGVTTLIDPEVQGGSVRYQKVQRPLLSPDQILNPEIANQLIVFLPAARPLHIGHIPWTEYDKFAQDYPLPPREPMELDEGLKLRFTEYQVEEQPQSKPWDPKDPNAANKELDNREQKQVKNDRLQEVEFRNAEKERLLTEDREQQQEIEQLKHYNEAKAHLAKEISGHIEAQKFLENFEAEYRELLASNKGKTLSSEQKENEEVAALKVRIMREIVQDMGANRLPQKPDGDYPLPWHD